MCCTAFHVSVSVRSISIRHLLRDMVLPMISKNKNKIRPTDPTGRGTVTRTTELFFLALGPGNINTIFLLTMKLSKVQICAIPSTS